MYPDRRKVCALPEEAKAETGTLKNYDMENMFCLIDGNRGIYIPQQFAKIWGDAVQYGMNEEQKNILMAGPDHNEYWDVWSEVVNDVVFLFDGERHTLYEDNDLFAVAN